MDAAFDFEATLARMGDDLELFRAIVGIVIKDAPLLLQQAEIGFACGNPEEVERAAHTLKGLMCNFDAAAVVQSAGSLEDCARRGRLERAGPIVIRLRADVAELLRQLEPHRGLGAG